MKENEKIQEFSLFGGPFHRLGCRLGLVRGGTNTFPVGVALALLTWVVLILLIFLMGLGEVAFSLKIIGVHVRFLVAIPLLFLCETFVFPRMSEFVRNIVKFGLVTEGDLPVLQSNIRFTCRMKDSWLAEAIFLVIAIALPLLERVVSLPGTMSWDKLLADSGGKAGLCLIWYLGFCLPLCRFLALRWIWRIALWWYFLWKVSKLDLNLIPTHPDGVAGLGYLEVVQEHFSPLAMALTAMYSASFAEEIASGKMAFEAVYYWIPLLIILFAVLFISPILLFSRKLWACRLKGLTEYMEMGSRYVNAFDRRWIRGENPTGEELLGTGDIQSLADLNNSMTVVREMRLVPFSNKLLTGLAASVIIPMLPLLLLKYPVDQLLLRLFQLLTGL